MTQKIRQVLLFTLLLALLTQYVNADLPSYAKIQAGIDQGQEAAITLAKKGTLVMVKDTVFKLVSKLRSFLSIAGPMVAIISALAPSGESAELKYMKQEFLQLNKRFDQIEQQLGDLKELVKWHSAMDVYMKCETQMLVLKIAMDSVLEAHNETYRNVHKAYFIKQYSKDGGRCARILLYGAVGDPGIMAKNLFDAVAKFTKFHLGKTHAFMLGTVKLLTAGALMDLTYYELVGKTRTGNVMNYQWDENLGNVGNRIIAVDEQIKKQYPAQSRIDVDNYCARSELSNEDLSEQLFNFVTEKYSFRRWLVVAFKDDMDRDFGYNCGGHWHKHCNGKTSVITASVSNETLHNDLIQNIVKPFLDKTESRMEKPKRVPHGGMSFRVITVCGNYLYHNRGYWDSQCVGDIQRAARKRGISIMDGKCHPYMFAVFIMSDDVYYYPHNRYIDHKKISATWVIVAGGI